MNLCNALAVLQGVRACGGYYMARCPAHDDNDPSLSVREGERGRLLFKCFRGCSYEAITAALGGRPTQRDGPVFASRALDDANRTELARRTWDQCRPPAGALVAVYLRTRGIRLPVPPSLRFHPSLKHLSGIYAPAMVAAVQNREGKIVAVHRTWLRRDGSGKADLQPQKAALGPIRGCAIRLADAGARLALAEGIETALSVAQACVDLQIWCAISASNLPLVELPAAVREVIICADNDPSRAGERAAQKAAQRFLSERRRVRITKPNGAKDFNDLRI